MLRISAQESLSQKDLSESLHLTSFSHFWFYHHLRFFLSFLTLENNCDHLSLACCWSSPGGPWSCLCCSPVYPQNKAGLRTDWEHFLAEIQHSVLYNGRHVSLLGKAIRYKASLSLTLSRHLCLLSAALGLHCWAGFLQLQPVGGVVQPWWAGSLLQWLLLWSVGSWWGAFSTCCTVAQSLWCPGPSCSMTRESSWTRDRTPVPCMGRRILNHRNTRENSPQAFFYSHVVPEGLTILTVTPSTFCSVLRMRMSGGLVRSRVLHLNDLMLHIKWT